MSCLHVTGSKLFIQFLLNSLWETDHTLLSHFNFNVSCVILRATLLIGWTSAFFFKIKGGSTLRLCLTVLMYFYDLFYILKKRCWFCIPVCTTTKNRALASTEPLCVYFFSLLTFDKPCYMVSIGIGISFIHFTDHFTLIYYNIKLWTPTQRTQKWHYNNI
jgi:hypothetical protein